MKIRFLGTGAAEGVPAVFCDCPVCQETRKRGEDAFHTRSQIWIDDGFSLDFPPDAYYHSLRFGVDFRKMKNLLVTHSHLDHFYAYDFVLRGYKYASAGIEPLTIYGNAEVKKVFDESVRREIREDVLSLIKVVTLTPFEEVSFDGYTVFPLLAQHSVKEDALVYLIEKNGKRYLHLTDTGRLPQISYEKLKWRMQGRKIDLIVFDCTFLFSTGGEVSRHMGLEDNQVVYDELFKRELVDENTKKVITHYSHNNAPLRETLLKAEKEYGVVAAYDGLTIEI